MTLEQLLEASASELEKLSDADLQKHFDKYLKVTRPELAPRAIKKAAPAPISFKRQQTLKALAAEGIDTSFLFDKRRRGK